MGATAQPQEERWVFGRLPVGAVRTRLICVPQAGAGAGAFAGWRKHIPAGWELAPVELPGRGAREAEPMPDGFDALADRLLAGLTPEFSMPYVLFGHSFGGALVYELSRRIAARGLPAPVATVVSGFRPPHVAPTSPMGLASDAELVDWLRRNGGLPDELLAFRTFLEQIMRVMRADLRLAESYLLAAPDPLPGPLHVFGGADDHVTRADVLPGWRDCAGASFSLTLLPGGHNYPHEDPAAMVAALTNALAPTP
ncbi:thioesterase II family protein [Streptomyces sp. NBC_00525]|uniref:thioesterase II family protein n=1 Tax=Streptomyces sp. NBC_00525 TaxID=2903660 RepID=UPI002E80C242|nr:alpha/beta fold hydrolase [Streptomyces sp. NBC_00525]WUC95208.1 alpha/beta fold hydrolase [Streptomyces sp. NBC_00525]